MSGSAKKQTNLSLNAQLVSEARAMRVNLSQAAEEGIRRAVSEVRAVSWKEQNAEALKSSNDWVEASGLPLEKYRPY